MNFDLPDQHKLIQRTAREVADDLIAPTAGERDEQKQFPYAIVAKLGELGMMGVPFPTEYGGGGADVLALTVVLEELARVEMATAATVSAHTSVGTLPI